MYILIAMDKYDPTNIVSIVGPFSTWEEAESYAEANRDRFWYSFPEVYSLEAP